MKSGKGTVLFLTCSGMEIAWRYAWAGFLTLAIFHRSFPLPEALVAFALAALFTRFSGQKSWQVYQTMLLHIAGFVFAAFLIIYGVCYGDSPFLSTAWIVDLFRQPKVPRQRFILLLAIFCSLQLWLGGRGLMKRSLDHLSVCIQFDKGLGALFLLLVIKLLVQEKGGVRIEYPATGFLVFSFFVFSLLSIGLARNQSSGQKSFLAGYHGIGIILGFTTIIVLCSVVLGLLFLPHLIHLSDTTQSVLKEATEPMGPVFVKIIRFIMGVGIRKYRGETGVSITTGTDANDIYPSANGGSEGLLWGLAGIIGLIALGVFVLLMTFIVRRLFKRNTADEGQHLSSTWILKFISVLATLPLKAWYGFLYLLKGVDSAVPAYCGILRWGRRSGLPSVPSETPMEYGSRLIHRFPRLKEEIEMIIKTFNMEVYGNSVINEQILYRIKSAQRRMRSPLHWPSRLRGRFVPL